jgi:alginate O-acetyltransferase complex protein AlgI
MKAPARAVSVAEFWGARWNLAFHELAHRYVFGPTRARLGNACALITAFAVSGLIHELVISVPARGGYGWPLSYFLLQGLALRLERSRLGRRLKLGHGWRGRLFAWLCVAGPAFWLFHPPFVLRVILPFLKVIHAL